MSLLPNLLIACELDGRLTEQRSDTIDDTHGRETMAETVNFGEDGYPAKTEEQPQPPSEKRRSLSMHRAESQSDDTPARGPRQSSSQTPANSRDEFTGAPVPLQIRVPNDLVQSLKLHSISTGQNMSELVLECLTTNATITKAWISTRSKRAA